MSFGGDDRGREVVDLAEAVVVVVVVETEAVVTKVVEVAVVVLSVVSFSPG